MKTNPVPDQGDLLTVPEACAFMRAGRCWIYENAESELGAVRNGRSIRIPRAGILAYWERKRLEREKAAEREHVEQGQSEALDRRILRIVEGGVR